MTNNNQFKLNKCTNSQLNVKYQLLDFVILSSKWHFFYNVSNFIYFSHCASQINKSLQMKPFYSSECIFNFYNFYKSDSSELWVLPEFSKATLGLRVPLLEHVLLKVKVGIRIVGKVFRNLILLALPGVRLGFRSLVWKKFKLEMKKKCNPTSVHE